MDSDDPVMVSEWLKMVCDRCGINSESLVVSELSLISIRQVFGWYKLVYDDLPDHHWTVNDYPRTVTHKYKIHGVCKSVLGMILIGGGKEWRNW